MRSALIFLVACGGGSTAKPIANTAAPAPPGNNCIVEQTHPLPAIGAVVSDDLVEGWQYSNEGFVPSGKVAARVAVDEAAGMSVMMFITADRHYLGAIAPPSDYLMSVAKSCPDGFVIQADTAPPMPRQFRRVKVNLESCSAGEWKREKPDC